MRIPKDEQNKSQAGIYPRQGQYLSRVFNSRHGHHFSKATNRQPIS